MTVQTLESMETIAEEVARALVRIALRDQQTARSPPRCFIRAAT